MSQGGVQGEAKKLESKENSTEHSQDTESSLNNEYEYGEFNKDRRKHPDDLEKRQREIIARIE